MKQWLRRKLLNLLNNDGEEAQPEIYNTRNEKVRAIGIVGSSDSKQVQSDPILQFRVFSAVGGRIVEFNQYDSKTDRRSSTTYIITHDQDFGERISKIATMESIKS